MAALTARHRIGPGTPGTRSAFSRRNIMDAPRLPQRSGAIAGVRRRTITRSDASPDPLAAEAQSSMSTPTGQWSEPISCGQMKASRTRRIAPGEATT